LHSGLRIAHLTGGGPFADNEVGLLQNRRDSLFSTSVTSFSSLHPLQTSRQEQEPLTNTVHQFFLQVFIILLLHNSFRFPNFRIRAAPPPPQNEACENYRRNRWFLLTKLIQKNGPKNTPREIMGTKGLEPFAEVKRLLPLCPVGAPPSSSQHGTSTRHTRGDTL
jgi:hypothetical protein